MASKYLENIPHASFNVCNVKVEKFGGNGDTVDKLMSKKLNSSQGKQGYSSSAGTFECEYVTSNLLPGFKCLGNYDDIHPLVDAIYSAWNNHHVLMLSPDDIWLTIAQSIGEHVVKNAEELRDIFVEHQGQKELNVMVDSNVPNFWETVVNGFSVEIEKNTKGDVRDVLECNFSTTGIVEKTASQIVLMYAMKEYFTYNSCAMCGIPKVILLGTVEDWKKVRSKFDKVVEYKMEWWHNVLSCILDEFVKAAEGNPNKEFWKKICNYESGSGWSRFSGWICAFFPYAGGSQNFNAKEKWTLDDFKEDTFSMQLEDFKGGICTVPFTLNGKDKTFTAGFVGTMVDSEEGIIRPLMSWGVMDGNYESKKKAKDEEKRKKKEEEKIAYKKRKDEMIRKIKDHRKKERKEGKTMTDWVKLCLEYRFYDINDVDLTDSESSDDEFEDIQSIK
ncbi:Domain of unknown function (DUF4419) [Orpheovirus IHUMI-LCC2]|uniref:DUF4419 domain-containing protein n=1 Tax=Orpheovirus IHUMI-LCC2 TaxID=2023057 RepID=A0A2I2L4E9_9VIRU|nr:Domain of unknown function (DUF4419) [Orpheovirus IHUMI-LCC2]SNW62380.1 Domain of unknown function (DUF4419) [Orpheovirus IHUMI-LCC2]